MKKKLFGVFLTLGLIVLCLGGLFLFDDALSIGSVQAEGDGIERLSAAATDESEVTEAVPEKTAEEIAADIAALVQASMTENGIDPSQVGIVVHDLGSDAVYAHNETTYFTAGSTYKLPLAMLIYEKIDAGALALTDTLYYDASYYEEGGSIGINYLPGASIAVSELLHCLIVDSDNTAAHILIGSMGDWLSFKQEAVKYSAVPIDENDGDYFSYYNVFTAGYMNDVLAYLWEHRDDFETLVDDLTAAKPDDYLNGVLGGTKMAQKYGQYEMAENAIGFSTSGHPYSIAVYTSLGYTGREWMGAVNAEIWQYFEELDREQSAVEETLE